MGCLTVYQPFAQLIVTGLKKLETRPFFTNYRGLLVIHAGRGALNVPSMNDHADKMLRANAHDPARLTRGAIIGAAFLDACYSAREWRDRTAVGDLINEHEEQLGFFTPSYFAWHLIEPVEFRHPIPCRGRIGLWEPGSELGRKIAAAIAAANL
jgi:hypothetical protein